MYKNQMKAQKILCLLAVIVAAVLFLYALGIMTDLYDALYPTLSINVTENKEAGGYKIDVSEQVFSGKTVSGAKVYTDMQPFNQTLVKLSIVYILLGVLLFITNTNVRRRYYIGNYVSVGLFAAASIGIPVYAHIQIENFKKQWQAVDFNALKEYSNTFKSTYTESTLWFDLHYAVCALMIVVAALLVACTVWKVMLMKDEEKLVAEGKGAKA